MSCLRASSLCRCAMLDMQLCSALSGALGAQGVLLAGQTVVGSGCLSSNC